MVFCIMGVVRVLDALINRLEHGEKSVQQKQDIQKIQSLGSNPPLGRLWEEET